MRASRLNRIRFACVAIGALLFAALGSAIGPALAGESGIDWVQVCTMSGSKWVNAKAGAAASRERNQGRMTGHCPWCSLQTPGLGLSDEPLISLAVPLTHRELARAEATAPRLARAWALASSRAPPSAC